MFGSVVPYHVGRSFRNPRERRFVGLRSSNAAFADGWSRDTIMAAHGAASAASAASLSAWPAKGPGRLLRIIATSLLTLAALVGASLLAAHVLNRRLAGVMIGVHATLAVAGYVIPTAYVFAG